MVVLDADKNGGDAPLVASEEKFLQGSRAYEGNILTSIINIWLNPRIKYRRYVKNQSSDVF